MLVRSMTALLLLLAPAAGFAEEIVPSPLDTEVRFSPADPIDADPVSVLLAHDIDTGCGWLQPELVEVTRTGQTIRIDIAGSTVFGGRPRSEATRSSATRAPKCTPPNQILVAQDVPLGPLPAGTYEIEIYLTHTNAQPEPTTVLTNRRTLEVAPAPDFVLLQDERFRASVDWTAADGSADSGRRAPGPTDDSALFTFFERENWELMVKVLDGCALNGHFWVFAAAATDVGYVLTVTDSASNERQSYTNPIGTRAPAIADTSAFPCSTDDGSIGATIASNRTTDKTSDTITPSPLRTSVSFTPEAPTDNTPVALLMAHELNSCGWRPPTASITRNGFSLRVDLESSPGFGGGLAVDRPTKCSPPVPYLEPQRVELGRFEPGLYDVEVYLTDVASQGPVTILTHRTSFQVAEGPDIVPLQNGRFATAAIWVTENDNGNARPVPGASDDSTLFTFFDDANWELMVKVLDGCAINDHYWVFTAAATDLQYNVGVRDETNGDIWFFDNPPGVRSPAVADTLAFPCSTTP